MCSRCLVSLVTANDLHLFIAISDPFLVSIEASGFVVIPFLFLKIHTVFCRLSIKKNPDSLEDCLTTVKTVSFLKIKLLSCYKTTFLITSNH